MKITCTLSEYTKMARQCGENKARFNCRNCPLNGVVELPDGESCDVERFVRAITMPNDLIISNPLDELIGKAPEAVAEAIKGVRLYGGSGEHLETR